MKKILSNLGILFMIYVVGLIFFIIYLFGRLERKIMIVGKVPKLRSKMMIIYNHPDIGNCMFEVFLAAMPFFREIMWHPFRFGPHFTPDQKNFTDKWYWVWLKPKAISINRKKQNGQIKELREMINVLKNFKGCIIHFFEGGRTRNGKIFMTSKKGERIRVPADSVGWMVDKIKARVLPTWISNGAAPKKPTAKLFSWPRFNREPIVIKMGTVIIPWESVKMDSHEITQKIAKSLLDLADQTG